MRVRNQSKLLPFGLLPIILSLAIVVIADAAVAITDNLNLSESISVSVLGAGVIKITDGLNLVDQIPSLIANAINVVTVTITSLITQIGTGNCSGASCFVPPNGSFLDTIATTIIIPAIFLAVTGFGVIYMGIKSFGIFVLMESFVFMGLAFLGIIPTWFTLLVILFVSAALAKIMWGFFRGGQSAF